MNRRAIRNNFFPKNRKGNLPIIILVIGVLVVCSLALLSFYAANFKVGNAFSGISKVEKLNSQIENNLYEGESVENLYEEIKARSGFPWLKEKVIFSVEYSPVG